ncbi:MAG: polyamine aminopropyltransferase [Pseudomonadota bacterium]
MLRFNRKIHKSVADDSVVEVSESNGIRSLHLGSVTIQSSMKVKDPFALELTYTRGMMGFLLFADAVKSVLTIGLGGGSVPKYIYAHCPNINQTIVEINPQIINIARSHFYVPDDDARLNVIEGDGIAHLKANQNSADCLMIDAFDRFGIPPNFCSQDFFDDCAATLSNQGNFDIYLQRIELSFNHHTLMLPTGKPGNIVVFGFKRATQLNEKKLRERAKALQNIHNIEFLSFVEKLCEHNHNYLTN